MSGAIEFPVRVAGIEQATPNVRRFQLAATSGEPLPPFAAGSHVVVLMNTGQRTIRNAYSLVDRAADGSCYRIAVLRSAESRGGSQFMHESVTVGSELKIAIPVNLFPLFHPGRKHLLIAGGIGITPIYSMADELKRIGANYEIYYAVRDDQQGAFIDELRERHGKRLNLYRSNLGEVLRMSDILPDQPLGTHLYVCGPQGMIDAVLEGGLEEGWPKENLHSELFLAPPTGLAFSARLAKSGITCEVRSDQSLLEALEEAGVDAPFLCRGGACGECECGVIETDGELVHNDHFLTPEERASQKKIMLCCSRIKGKEIVLDL